MGHAVNINKIHTHTHTHTHTSTIRSYVFINKKQYSSLPGYLVMTGAKNHGMCSLHLQQRVEQCWGLFTIRFFYCLIFVFLLLTFTKLTLESKCLESVLFNVCIFERHATFLLLFETYYHYIVGKWWTFSIYIWNTLLEGRDKFCEFVTG